MKKVILSMMVAMSVMLIASCNNTKDETTSDAQNVEAGTEKSNLEDVVEPSDTAEAVTRGGSSSEGFGRCSKCSCKEFEGRGDVCRNCGHAYKAHY